MYRAILLDDEVAAIRTLQHQLTAHPELEIVEACSTLASARQAIEQHQPDIIFLDIRIHSRVVFPLVEDLWRKGLTPSIIFVTAWGKDYLEQAIATCEQLFQWSYLTKPVEDEALADKVNRFLEVQARRRGSSSLPPPTGRLKIRTGSNEWLIDFDKIVYCASNGNYVDVHYLQGGKLNKKIWSGSLRKIMKEALPKPEFVRISGKNSINRMFLGHSASNGKWCVLDHPELPEEVKLGVPQRKRVEVWKKLFKGGDSSKWTPE